MSATIPVSRSDAQVLYALASLARVQPESKRAAHLVPKVEAIARRIIEATDKDSLHVAEES